MSQLARCNGTVLVGDGRTIGVVERGGGWLGTAIFVTVLLALLLLVAGGAIATAHPLPGIGIVAGGLVMAAFAMLFIKKKRQLATAPPAAPWLVFDCEARVVRDGAGGHLCTFGEVRIERVFQAGSSSKALAVYCPDKTVVARGTPFGDEVDDVERVLRSAVGC